jgi:hypothetical protein
MFLHSNVRDDRIICDGECNFLGRNVFIILIIVIFLFQHDIFSSKNDRYEGCQILVKQNVFYVHILVLLFLCSYYACFLFQFFMI